MIRYWNRDTKRLEEELVYGEEAIRWAYDRWLGRAVSNALLTRPAFSRLYGKLQDSRWSQRKIRKFIADYRIRMDEFESHDFPSFNQFFIRRFRPGARPFEQDPAAMPAFAEGRYLAFESLREDQKFPIKGMLLTAEGLLDGRAEAARFRDGPCLIARLCPTDYHRFHYPDDGTTSSTFTLAGALHSVNPLALARKGDILITNERQVSVLETRNFGQLAYVEVGALCVGKIVQTHPLDQPFKRGDEKGYFLFGGSTVVVLGEPGRWRPDAELLDQTSKGFETFVRLGEGLAHRTPPR